MYVVGLVHTSGGSMPTLGLVHTKVYVCWGLFTLVVSHCMLGLVHTKVCLCLEFTPSSVPTLGLVHTKVYVCWGLFTLVVGLCWACSH